MVLGRLKMDDDDQTYLEAIELTQDHKPDNPEEFRRINEAGGRVDRLVSGKQPLPEHMLLVDCWVGCLAGWLVGALAGQFIALIHALPVCLASSSCQVDRSAPLACQNPKIYIRPTDPNPVV